MWHWILKLLGYNYLLNKNTGEVHDLRNLKSRCGIDKMSNKNKKFLNESEYNDLMKIGKFEKKSINGCRFCMEKLDSDKHIK